MPCVALRDSTERPETIDCGANIIGGFDPTSVLSAVTVMMGKDRSWDNPFGDGKSSEHVLNIIKKNLK